MFNNDAYSISQQPHVENFYITRVKHLGMPLTNRSHEYKIVVRCQTNKTQTAMNCTDEGRPSLQRTKHTSWKMCYRPNPTSPSQADMQDMKGSKFKYVMAPKVSQVGLFLFLVNVPDSSTLGDIGGSSRN
ncbi:hypothetical protein D5086_018748 [Populus alba]|uniref:Uncharacterized protein n=3 Tax=Populus TaxID=3689 RepID=A0ACC4BQN0_POPAL|nr:hypothetical protein NC653_023756 [Populus alba x Populus x berolinensis]KAJ6985928.1 hypothetical protein NC653_023759 [Populus alba x Populus x berolinensis]TKR66149.1 hypothetical protein D5086_0000313910 [Populus alba]